MEMQRKGVLIVISGFSGAGKGTIMKELLNKYPSQYALSISATTRNPRIGEVNGREYFFKTKEEFEAMIDCGELIEHAQYVGNYYGTPKAYVEEKMSLGKDVILEIEIQGALEIKKKFPETVLMFISPPSAIALKERLEHRGTEDFDTIQKRLLRASEEAMGIDQYDYFVINDALEACVEEVHSIIQHEKARVSRNINVINAIRDELHCFSKGE